MKNESSRRDFLKVRLQRGRRLGGAGERAGAAWRLRRRRRVHIKKAVLISMLPKQLSYADRFKLAREVGFEAVEAPDGNRPARSRGNQEGRGRRQESRSIP